MLSRQDIDYDALVKEDRVHISLYTDPSVFTEEMDKIFHRGWVYVGHQGEVPNSGDFRLKRIGLQPVIMVRDQHGQVQRNTRSFRCMYHGWTYHLDGELSGVPGEEAYGSDFARQELSLVKVPASLHIVASFLPA
jgi:phenylpropionate dioxygenase-like ring-hydroxylating dioxygenase large terminal subunit